MHTVFLVPILFNWRINREDLSKKSENSWWRKVSGLLNFVCPAWTRDHECSKQIETKTETLLKSLLKPRERYFLISFTIRVNGYSQAFIHRLKMWSDIVRYDKQWNVSSRNKPKDQRTGNFIIELTRYTHGQAVVLRIACTGYTWK